MKRSHAALLVALLTAAAMSGGDRPDTPSPSHTDVPAFAAGQVLTLDASGEFSTRAPQAAELRDALGEALSTSSEGLVEEKSTVPGGGVMVDLQGRFQNAMTYTVNADGSVSAPCLTEAHAETAANGEVK
jgi:hypothetical protein